MKRLPSLLLLVPPVVAAGGEAWYKHEYEYSYVESVTLIILLCLALIFETFWHKVTHHAQHAYKYGKLHKIAYNHHDSDDHDKHGNMRHVCLPQELVHRAGGEFMTLGFLAFCVFMFNNTGGFASIAKQFVNEGEGGHRRLASNSDDEELWHFPVTDQDWLHMVEIVHMKLFVGMVFYFCLANAVVRGSSQIIQKWEALRLRRLQLQSTQNLESINESNRNLQMLHHDEELNRYLTWRNFFINRVVEWKQRRPGLFLKMLDTLDIDPSDVNAPDRLRIDMEERCAFSSYLALNVEYGVRDTIAVHTITWGFVIVIFSLFAVMHRYAKISCLSILQPFFVILFLMILGMRTLVRLRENQVNHWDNHPRSKHHQDDHPHSASMEVDVSASGLPAYETSFHQRVVQRVESEMYILRGLQVVLFLICYAFSQTVMDIQAWQARPEEVLLMSLLFALLFTLLAYMLPSQVPLFLALMSLPPYVDTLNFALLQRCIDDHAMPKGALRDSFRQATLDSKRCTRNLQSFQEEFLTTVDSQPSDSKNDSDNNEKQFLSLQSAQDAFSRISSQLNNLEEFERSTVEAQQAKDKELKLVWEKLKSLEGSLRTLTANTSPLNPAPPPQPPVHAWK